MQIQAVGVSHQPTDLVMRRLSLQEFLVLDLIFIGLTCALFLLGAGYAVLCDRL